MTILEENTMHIINASLPSIARSLETIAKQTDSDTADENSRLRTQLERLSDCASAVVKAVLEDALPENRDERGHSGVILHGVGEAQSHLTKRFNELIRDLEDAIEEAQD